MPERAEPAAAAESTDAVDAAAAPPPAARRRIIGAVVVLVVVAVVVVALVAGGAESDIAVADPGTPPRFVDDTATSGIAHAYDGEFDFFVGGGVATFDCDDDRFADLYFAGGVEPAALYRNRSDVGGPLQFAVEPSPVTDLVDVTGAYPIDIDGDRTLDLVVLRNGPNVVLRGTGDCGFVDATDDWGIDAGDEWTVGFSATWEEGASLPTLAFANYLAADRRSCADSELVRPAGDGRYAPPVALSPGYCSLSALFSDWSGTGRVDLRLTNDRHYYRDGSEQLWRVEPGATPRLYDGDDGWRPLQIWGMGIASHDLDLDGRPEIFLTSQGDNKLQQLADGADGPEYVDIALRRNATSHRPAAGDDVRPSTAWHPEFGDVNADGHPDLLITKGNVEAQTDHAMDDPTDLLIGHADGTFESGADAAGIIDFTGSRGATVTDLNLDGMPDLVLVRRRADAVLWRNVGQGTADEPAAMGHWLAIRLRQAAPDVDAIGARIEVSAAGDPEHLLAARELTIGGGHASGELGWTHVGLAARDTVDVRVRWPDGEVGPWTTVDADRFVVIDRTGGDPAEVVVDR